MVRRHGLTDDQWELVSDIFGEPKPVGRPPKDRRLVLDGIFWILRTGAAWRDLPERFGPWQSIYHCFNKWTADGTFDAILRRLQGAMVDAEELDDDLWCVDGTVVRAARCAAGAKKRGPKATMLATKH